MSNRILLCSAMTLIGVIGLVWAQQDQETATVPAPDAPRAPVTLSSKDALEKSTVTNGVNLNLRMRTKTPAGEPVEVAFTIENRSNRDIVNGFQNPGDCDFVLKVLNDVEKEVPYTLYGQFRKPREPVRDFVSYHVVTIPPGQSHSTIINLNLLFDLTIPGRYRLEAQKSIDLWKPSCRELKLGNCEFYITRPPVRQRLPQEPNGAASRPKG